MNKKEFKKFLDTMDTDTPSFKIHCIFCRNNIKKYKNLMYCDCRDSRMWAAYQMDLIKLKNNFKKKLNTLKEKFKVIIYKKISLQKDYAFDKELFKLKKKYKKY